MRYNTSQCLEGWMFQQLLPFVWDGKSFSHGFSNWSFPLLVDSYTSIVFFDGKKQNWFAIGKQTGGMFYGFQPDSWSKPRVLSVHGINSQVLA